MEQSTNHTSASPDHPPARTSRIEAFGGRIASSAGFLGLVVALAVFAAASAGIVLMHEHADQAIHRSVKDNLRSLAVAAAHSIDPELHAQVTQPGDTALVAYQRALDPLERLQRTLTEVKYVYTFRATSPEDVVFVLDPPILSATDSSVLEPSVPPGTRYGNPEPAMVECIRTHRTTASPEVYTDEWGSFVSAYSPVFARDGSVECFVGLDMTAATFKSYEDDVHVAAGISFAFSAVVSTGIGIGVTQWRSRRIDRERAQRATQSLLSRATENVPGGVFIYTEGSDGLGRVTFASTGFRELCGACASRGPTRDAIIQLLLPDDRALATQALEASRKDLSVWQGEYRSSDGDRWLEVRALPRRMADGSLHWHGFVADATARKLAEAELREAKARAERASRIKSEFVANTSHELRTPLAAIVGYSEVLLEPGNLPEDSCGSREAVESIARNAEHMLGVIGDIVDGEQLAAGRLQVSPVAMDAAAVASDVTRLLANRAQRKGLGLRFEPVAAGEAMVSADPMRVRQILLNLAGNALKFTERGEVTISIEPGERTLAIAVRDTGPGMDAEQVGRLFERFSQTSPEHAALGSGLGLAISRQLARLIGGNISVTSAPGAGTTFRLHLLRTGAPGTPEATPRLDQGLTGNANRPLDGLQVLLAEDGADNVRLIRHHLERAGAEVTVVGDGKVAAATVRAAHLGVLERPFDLVLMDLDLPGMDGLSATRDLRASGIDVPIVALTAHSAADDRVRALDAGCNDFASKPVGRTDLLMLALRWGSAGRSARASALEPVPVPENA